MWFPFALLSAIFYALLFILARMSRGMPSTIVTSVQFALGPLLLAYTSQSVDYPWAETWWQWYLILPVIIIPLTQWGMTYALHRTEVTLVKPLFGLSSIATIIVGSLFFGEEVIARGVVGILLITIGLCFLYHGRWGAWRERGPWIVLIGAIVFGSNAAVVAVVLSRFPHILSIAALVLTMSFVVNGAFSARSWRRMQWTRRNIAIIAGLILTMASQDIATLYAFTLGPSAYVIAVKRTSVLLTAVIGYFFLHERDQSLTRLLISSALVVLGVMSLTL